MGQEGIERKGFRLIAQKARRAKPSDRNVEPRALSKKGNNRTITLVCNTKSAITHFMVLALALSISFLTHLISFWSEGLTCSISFCS